MYETFVIITGTIQVDGEAANGTNAGGGSGGTIDITTPVLEGNGEIRSNGGKGDEFGGGGAGGRMVLKISNTYVYLIFIIVHYLYM